MALPLGEAGISEIPNEQAVLAAMQSNIAEKSGLYFFPGLGVGPNATRQEKDEAMKQEVAKMASGPSGLLIYNYARPFAFAKALTIEFATELVEAILVVFLLAQTTIASFPAGQSASSWLPGNSRRHCHQCFLCKLVRLPLSLHRQPHVHSDHRLFVRWYCRCPRVAKARSRCLKLSSLEVAIYDLNSRD